MRDDPNNRESQEERCRSDEMAFAAAFRKMAAVMMAKPATERREQNERENRATTCDQQPECEIAEKIGVHETGCKQ
jgi:hypothetical protein